MKYYRTMSYYSYLYTYSYLRIKYVHQLAIAMYMYSNQLASYACICNGVAIYGISIAC